MSIWCSKNNNWMPCDWYSEFHPGMALIVGSGQSVKDEFKLKFPACTTKFVQNLACKYVAPDIYLAMDLPSNLTKKFPEYNIINQPCPKIFRGNHGNDSIDGVPVKSFSETYFIDVEQKPRGNIFTDQSPNKKFIWINNTLSIAIQLALHRGFKKLGFIGVDVCGDYADGRESNEAIKLLLTQELEFMQWLSKCCVAWEIELFNYAGAKSKLGEIAGVKNVD
jgi:hypothetical protein